MKEEKWSDKVLLVAQWTCAISALGIIVISIGLLPKVDEVTILGLVTSTRRETILIAGFIQHGLIACVLWALSITFRRIRRIEN